MSRTFTDQDLQTWEAYASAGETGLASGPRVVFHCISDPHRRARFTSLDGDEADAEATVHTLSVDDIRGLLSRSSELP